MNLSQYVGIPFEDRKMDCYGLVRFIYKNELGIEIPRFSSSCLDTLSIYRDYLNQISKFWAPVSDYEVFDVVAMAYDPYHPRIVTHFGIYIGNGKMLHSLKGIGSFTCQMTDYSYCIKGVYRWVDTK